MMLLQVINLLRKIVSESVVEKPTIEAVAGSVMVGVESGNSKKDPTVDEVADKINKEFEAMQATDEEVEGCDKAEDKEESAVDIDELFKEQESESVPFGSQEPVAEGVHANVPQTVEEKEESEGSISEEESIEEFVKEGEGDIEEKSEKENDGDDEEESEDESYVPEAQQESPVKQTEVPEDVMEVDPQKGKRKGEKSVQETQRKRQKSGVPKKPNDVVHAVSSPSKFYDQRRSFNTDQRKEVIWF